MDNLAASYECDTESEVTLLGGVQPGEGTVIFKDGLVCDDSWDLKVFISVVLSEFKPYISHRMQMLYVRNLVILVL